jgi:hypothetical protein
VIPQRFGLPATVVGQPRATFRTRDHTFEARMRLTVTDEDQLHLVTLWTSRRIETHEATGPVSS